MDHSFGLDTPTEPDEGLALLTTCYGGEQLTVCEALLRGAGGAMNILAGYTLYATDPYVRESDLEAARALFRAEAEDETDAGDPDGGDT